MVKTQNVDIELLRDAIERSGLKTRYISSMLGITPQAFGAKCRGQVAFRKSEVYVMKDLLRLSDRESTEIFFPEMST